jgi:hypothetical protein
MQNKGDAHLKDAAFVMSSFILLPGHCRPQSPDSR